MERLSHWSEPAIPCQTDAGSRGALSGEPLLASVLLLFYFFPCALSVSKHEEKRIFSEAGLICCVCGCKG